MSDTIVWLLRLVELQALFYLILIGTYTYGWRSLLSRPSKRTAKPESITVIVAMRNEAAHIPSLADALLHQEWVDKFKLIILDDHSTDAGWDLLMQLKKQHGDIIIPLKSNGFGKKAALHQAIEAATSDLILVTDADCVPAKNWMHSMVTAFEDPGIQLVLGPVRLEHQHRLFGMFQALEFNSLMGSTAGSAAIGVASMSNGANMAFRKQAFTDVSLKRNDAHFASGDDMFLLSAIVRQFGSKSVAFCAEKEAVVSTAAAQSFRSFILQRLRWVSKSKGYRSPAVLIPAWVVLLFNMSLATLLISSMFFSWMLPLAVLFLTLKALIDYPLLRSVCRFMDQKNLMWLFVPLTILYPFYVVFTALGGMLFNVSWKGRKVR